MIIFLQEDSENVDFFYGHSILLFYNKLKMFLKNKFIF